MPPEWKGNTPGFSFTEYLNSEQGNPLQALGDIGSGAAAEQSNGENKAWWRKAANTAGNIGGTIAKWGAVPAAAVGGPLGLAAAGGLGALSYLGQQA